MCFIYLFRFIYIHLNIDIKSKSQNDYNFKTKRVSILAISFLESRGKQVDPRAKVEPS
jgi:hypothetical protein